VRPQIIWLAEPTIGQNPHQVSYKYGLVPASDPTPGAPRAAPPDASAKVGGGALPFSS